MQKAKKNQYINPRLGVIVLLLTICFGAFVILKNQLPFAILSLQNSIRVALHQPPELLNMPKDNLPTSYFSGTPTPNPGAFNDYRPDLIPITSATKQTSDRTTVEISSSVQDQITMKQIPYDLKFTTPLSWKFHRADGGWGKIIATLDLEYPFAEYPHTAFSGGNFFVSDFTEWVNTADPNMNLTPSDKSQFIKYVMNYDEKNTTSHTSQERYIQLFQGECVNSPIQTKNITAMNGQLTGLTSIGFSKESFEPTPFVTFCLAGKVNDRLIFITGSFDLKDKKTSDLDEILSQSQNNNEVPSSTTSAYYRGTLQAMKDYGHQLPSDTQEMWNQFQDVIRSLQIRINK